MVQAIPLAALRSEVEGEDGKRLSWQYANDCDSGKTNAFTSGSMYLLASIFFTKVHLSFSGTTESVWSFKTYHNSKNPGHIPVLHVHVCDHMWETGHSVQNILTTL